MSIKQRLIKWLQRLILNHYTKPHMSSGHPYAGFTIYSLYEFSKLCDNGVYCIQQNTALYMVDSKILEINAFHGELYDTPEHRETIGVAVGPRR